MKKLNKVEEKCRDYTILVAEAGNFWWKAGHPAIAEKLMEANIMMLEAIVPLEDRNEEAHQGMLRVLEEIRRDLEQKETPARPN